MRVFRVVEDSMRPALAPGDGLVALLGGAPQRGQLRLFRHPTKSRVWMVKRVGEVFVADSGTIFEALSDNPGAATAGDSRELGWISAAGSYRVLFSTRGKVGR
jgi:hypothetical protein